MRAMAIVAGAITVAGIYLAVAATIGIGTTATALGILAIALISIRWRAQLWHSEALANKR